MQSRILTVLLLAVFAGFATGFVTRPFLVGMVAGQGNDVHTFAFDGTVMSYAYSEKGVTGIEKSDDRSVTIQAVNPGMCVITISTAGDAGLPEHFRRKPYIVSVSPERKLTIQQTTFLARRYALEFLGAARIIARGHSSLR